MTRYQQVAAHEAAEATVPRPDQPVDPCFVTTQDGVPVLYGEDTVPMCGIRVVHPSNPNAPSHNHSVAVVYLPPHASIELHSHETEETYAILSGSGTFAFHNGEREVGAGDFVYLPPWCEHGLENTGREVIVALLATSPPNP